MKLSYPTCWVCNKRVEKFNATRSELCRRTTFVARCHGDTQVVVLTDAEIASIISIEVTKAFDPRRR